MAWRTTSPDESIVAVPGMDGLMQLLRTPLESREEWMSQTMVFLTKDFDFFRKHATQHYECSKYFTLQTYETGEEVVEYNSDPDNFFLLLEGTGASTQARWLYSSRRRSQRSNKKSRPAALRSSTSSEIPTSGCSIEIILLVTCAGSRRSQCCHKGRHLGSWVSFITVRASLSLWLVRSARLQSWPGSTTSISSARPKTRNASKKDSSSSDTSSPSSGILSTSSARLFSTPLKKESMQSMSIFAERMNPSQDFFWSNRAKCCSPENRTRRRVRLPTINHGKS